MPVIINAAADNQKNETPFDPSDSSNTCLRVEQTKYISSNMKSDNDALHFE